MSEFTKQVLSYFINKPGPVATFVVIVIVLAFFTRVVLKKDWNHMQIILGYVVLLTLGVLFSFFVTLPYVQTSIRTLQYDELKYSDLFDNIESNSLFKGYNVPWKLEEASGYSWEKALEVHRKRYRNGVTSYYLFFDDSSFYRARKFWKELQRTANKEFDLHDQVTASTRRRFLSRKKSAAR